MVDAKIIAVFVSTHETLRAEKVFMEAGIKIRTRIKPRRISANCQMALAFPDIFLEDIYGLVKKNRLEMTGVYREDHNGNWVEI